MPISICKSMKAVNILFYQTTNNIDEFIHSLNDVAYEPVPNHELSGLGDAIIDKTKTVGQRLRRMLTGSKASSQVPLGTNPKNFPKPQDNNPNSSREYLDANARFGGKGKRKNKTNKKKKEEKEHQIK